MNFFIVIFDVRAYLNILDPFVCVAVYTLGDYGLHVLGAGGHVEEGPGAEGVVEGVLVAAEVVVHLAGHQSS